MSEEEKKPVEAENKPAEEESDFADEEKPVPVPEEKKEEAKPDEPEKPAEPEINLHKDEEVVVEAAPVDTSKLPTDSKKKPVISYVYDDESLANIEADRKTFFQQYKKSNLWKYLVSGLCVVIIIIGYILPLQIEAWKPYQMWITLPTLAVGVVILGVFSVISRKKIEAKMKDYFRKFYENTNKFVMSDPDISNLAGTVDDKLTPDAFNAAGLYKDVAQVGSRASLTFS